MNTFTIAINKDFNSVEVSFAEKPEAIVLETLKKNGFRWHWVRKVWYAYKTTGQTRAILKPFMAEKRGTGKHSAVPEDAKTPKTVKKTATKKNARKKSAPARTKSAPATTKAPASVKNAPVKKAPEVKKATDPRYLGYLSTLYTEKLNAAIKERDIKTAEKYLAKIADINNRLAA